MEKIYVTKRFGLDIFLFEMSQLFELVVFTAGLRDYTDEVLKNIDPKKRIKHVLYREHCTILNKTYFLKNLSLLGRNLKQTILIDVMILLFRIIQWQE
jgi:RNA polymerase II subunit A small phosphatase-like protein